MTEVNNTEITQEQKYENTPPISSEKSEQPQNTIITEPAYQPITEQPTVVDEINKKLRQRPQIVENPQPDITEVKDVDLPQAAKALAHSEYNKEDLSEEEILNNLQSKSEEEVKQRLGFWAVPLPKDDSGSSTNTRYTGKNK